VAVYALLFLGALWFLHVKSPLFVESRPAGSAPAAGRRTPDAKTGGLSRASLLEAAALAPLPRAEYFRRLSSDCCPCGCDLNLRDCLLSDQACTRSPQVARALLQHLQ